MSAAIFGSHLPFDKSFGVPSIYFGEEPVGQVTKEFLADVRERIISSACYWSEQRKVYWLTPVPELPKDAARWVARMYLINGPTEITISRVEYNARNDFVLSSLTEAASQCPNFQLIESVDIFCDEERCYGSQDGMPLYYDYHHLSERGNKLLVETFLRELN